MATAPLLSIPNVKSFQIPPGTTTSSIPLKTGTLTLTEPLAGSSVASADTKLLLTITPNLLSLDQAPLTIPLHPDNFIGSRGGLCQTFRFAVPGPDSENLGAIEVEFPEDISEEDALNFEKVFVYNGFLLTGLVADASDFSRAITSKASNVASFLSKKTDERNEKTPPTEEDHEFSDITKDIVGGTEKGTEKVATVTGDIGTIISNAVHDAGAWVGSKTGIKGGSTTETDDTAVESNEPKSFVRESVDQALDAGAIAGIGIGRSVKTVGSEIGESGSKIVKHDYGTEAKELVDSTRQSGANVGGAAVDAFVGTSVIINAAEAGVGAVKEDKYEEKKEKLEQ